MNHEFTLVVECCVCGKHKPCVIRDEDLDGAVCEDCIPDLSFAQDVIVNACLLRDYE